MDLRLIFVAGGAGKEEPDAEERQLGPCPEQQRTALAQRLGGRRSAFSQRPQGIPLLPQGISLLPQGISLLP